MQAPIDLRSEVLTFNKASTPEGNKSPASEPQQNPNLSCPTETRGGGFEPTHGSTAADTSIEIRPEDMSQQPGPTFTGRASVSVGIELGELKLVAGSRRRLESGRIL